MGLKPQNIVQAAKADREREVRNIEFARRYRGGTSEQYAFHRAHVRKTETVRELIRLALMDPTIIYEGTAKRNTKLIYGNARLLVAAIRMTESTDD